MAATGSRECLARIKLTAVEVAVRGASERRDLTRCDDLNMDDGCDMTGYVPSRG